ncbi:hypothetical protein AB0M39_36080 [Streptomyces sp. NPDC051907]|uniref:hypothetical protein n=1 Tax=Streptomyces sp. NPDC051907 TaxID=3155284 RepID=UPI0034439E35
MSDARTEVPDVPDVPEAPEVPEVAAPGPRRSGLRIGVLSTLAVLGGLGVLWIVLLFTTNEPGSRGSDVKAAETFAHVASDQFPGQIRFYVPAQAEVTRATSGAVVASLLRYDITATRDSSVANFITTYDIGASGKAVASPTGAVFTEEIDGRTRTVRVEYTGKAAASKPFTGADPLRDPRLPDTPATIVVTTED